MASVLMSGIKNMVEDFTSVMRRRAGEGAGMKQNCRM